LPQRRIAAASDWEVNLSKMSSLSSKQKRCDKRQKERDNEDLQRVHTAQVSDYILSKSSRDWKPSHSTRAKELLGKMGGQRARRHFGKTTIKVD